MGVSAIGSALRSAVYYTGSATASLYERIPDVVKTPFEMVASYTWAHAKAGKELTAAFITGTPLHAFGKRIPTWPEKQPISSYQVLTDVGSKIDIFEEGQPLLPPLPDRKISVPILPKPPNSALALSTKQTNDLLKSVIANYDLYVPLLAMHAISGVKDDNPDALTILARKAAIPKDDGTKPSLRALFLEKYGSQMTVFQKLFISLFHWMFSSRLIPKTLDAYAKEILRETRKELLNQRWTEKEDLIQGALQKVLLFLEVYRNATVEWAHSPPLIPLNEFRKQALEKVFPTLSQELSDIVMYNFSPYVLYFQSDFFLLKHVARFLNWIINGCIHWTLRRWLLPQVILKTSTEADKAMQPHHLPFAKAFADTARTQMHELGKQKHTLSPPPLPSAGTKLFTDAIRTFMEVLPFANLNTQGEIQKKAEELKQQNGVDGLIQEGIQDSILMSTYTFLHHLAEPEHSEEAFQVLLNTANLPFSKGEIVTAENYAQSKKLLDDEMKIQGSKLAYAALETRMQTSRPESIEEEAEKVLQAHREFAQITHQEIAELFSRVNDKASRLMKNGWSKTDDLLGDLEAIKSALKKYNIGERITQDLKILSEASQESILRPLIPLYESTNQMMDYVLSLQQSQLTQQRYFEIDQEQAKEFPNISRWRQAIEALAPRFPLSFNLDQMANTQQQIASTKETLNTLASLQAELPYLEGKQKRQAIYRIDLLIRKLPHKDQKPVSDWINGVLTCRYAQQYPPAWKNLNAGIAQLQTAYQNQRDQLAQQFNAQLPVFNAWKTQIRDETNAAMDRATKDLGTEIRAFQRQSATMVREPHLHLTNRHWGLIGAAATGIFALFNPATAGFVAAAAHTAFRQVGNFLRGNSHSIQAAVRVGTGGAIGGAVAAIAQIALPPPLAVAIPSLGGSIAGTQAMPRLMEGSHDKIHDEVLKFFHNAYDFFLSGNIFGLGARIPMQMIVDAYKK